MHGLVRVCMVAALVAGCGTSAELWGDATADSAVPDAPVDTVAPDTPWDPPVDVVSEAPPVDADDEPECPCWGCPDSLSTSYYFIEHYMEDPEPARESLVLETGDPGTGDAMVVSAVLRDEPCDGLDATIFVDHVEPNPVGGVADPVDPTILCMWHESEDTDGDTVPDVLTAVEPGTPVCFDIYPAMNETVEGTDVPQVFLLYVDAASGDGTVLDTVEIYFLVPPAPGEPPIE